MQSRTNGWSHMLSIRLHGYPVSRPHHANYTETMMAVLSQLTLLAIYGMRADLCTLGSLWVALASPFTMLLITSQYVMTGYGLEAYHLQPFERPRRKSSNSGTRMVSNETRRTNGASQDSCGHI
jgi:hypothetical protein